MKLISKKEKHKCFETTFDKGLIKGITYDKSENIFIINYDSTDVGMPAGFIAPIEGSTLFVKVTDQYVYADCIFEFSDDADDFCKTMCNEHEMTAEFVIQFSPQETIELLIILLKKAHN